MVKKEKIRTTTKNNKIKMETKNIYFDDCKCPACGYFLHCHDFKTHVENHIVSHIHISFKCEQCKTVGYGLQKLPEFVIGYGEDVNMSEFMKIVKEYRKGKYARTIINGVEGNQ